MTVLEKTNVEVSKRELVLYGMTNGRDINLDDLVFNLYDYDKTYASMEAILRGFAIQYGEELGELEYEDLDKRLNFFNDTAARLVAYIDGGDKELLKDYRFDNEDLFLDHYIRYYKAVEVLSDFIIALDIEASYRNIHGEEFLIK